MKKKVFRMFVVTLLLSAVMSVTSFAGQWKQDSKGWWWVNDDGSYPANTWQWIDGNSDGIAECYYFDAVGYMWTNNKPTPDGYLVDANGAWIVNGIPQTMQVISANDMVSDDTNMLGKYYYYDFWMHQYLDWCVLHCDKNSDGTYHIYTVLSDGTVSLDFTCFAKDVSGDMAGTAFYEVGTDYEILRYVDEIQEFAYWGGGQVEYFGKNLS